MKLIVFGSINLCESEVFLENSVHTKDRAWK